VHTHAHPNTPGLGRRLQFSLWITTAFIVIEVFAGLRADSLALLSDAGHNFTDALALALAWAAFRWQQLPPDPSRTFGYQRTGVLAAFVNALVLIVLSLWIFWESYERFLAPRPVEENLMLWVAGAGLVVNLAVMKALHADTAHDLNVRGAYLHMLGDALSSVGIVIGAVALKFTNALWIDPLLSVLIGALIIWSAWGVFRESMQILLEGLPAGLDRDGVCESLKQVDGVLDVHDLHIWSLSSDARALSCHALIEDVPPSESRVILRRVNAVLERDFNICHTTVQFEHVECEHAEEICTGVHKALAHSDHEH